MKIFLTLILLSFSLISYSQEHKDITTKNFEKKFSTDCKACYLKYENDPFTKKVVGETHKIQITESENSFFSVERTDQAFIVRIYDSEHDVRNYDVCKFMLQNGEIITLEKAVKLGHKADGKKAIFSRDFPINKAALEKIKTSGFKNIRLEYSLKQTHHNYDVPAANETIAKFVMNCILSN